MFKISGNETGDNCFLQAFISSLCKDNMEIMTLHMNVREADEAVEEYYNARLRNIFNDPQGRYYLEWNDFCLTGKLILNPEAMRHVAVLLINRSEDLIHVGQ